MKLLRALAWLYVGCGTITAVGMWVLAHHSGHPMGLLDAAYYGATWPIVWLLGFIFWLAAAGR